MPVYQDAGTLERVLTELFDRVIADPEGLAELSSKKMVFLFDVTEPAMMVTVNGKNRPPTWSHGRTESHVNLAIHTRMDVLHQVLLKDMRVRDAFFGKKMQVDGSLLTARRLEGLFHVLQKHYPLILDELQLLARPARRLSGGPNTRLLISNGGGRCLTWTRLKTAASDGFEGNRNE